MAQTRVDVEARELAVVIDVPELSPVVDGRLLSRVIQNLYDNAVRYAPRRGIVEIKARIADKQLVISVGNSGPPLTFEEKTSIFERDYRAAQRQAGARMGRDFGLYFCRLVIEAHKGSITIEEREGMPAVFVVRIPQ